MRLSCEKCELARHVGRLRQRWTNISHCVMTVSVLPLLAVNTQLIITVSDFISESHSKSCGCQLIKLSLQASDSGILHYGVNDEMQTIKINLFVKADLGYYLVLVFVSNNDFVENIVYKRQTNNLRTCYISVVVETDSEQ